MSIADLIDAARARLGSVAQETLGEFVEPRRILGIARPPRITRAGSAWHVGVLLISDEDVYAVGEILRSREGVPRGYTAESQRRRAELAAAAFRGGIPAGETVHLGWRRIDVSAAQRGEQADPLTTSRGVPSIRWSASGGLAPLAGYLDERIALLVAPPPGA